MKQKVYGDFIKEVEGTKTHESDYFKTANSHASVDQVSLSADKVIELIKSIHINPANFEYIAKMGKINGTLFTEIARVIKEAVAESNL